MKIAKSAYDNPDINRFKQLAIEYDIWLSLGGL